MNAARDDSPGVPPASDLAERLDRLQRTLESVCVRLAALGRPDVTAFTTAEFAALTGLAAYTVRDHLKTGRIAGTRAPGQGWRIARAELDRYEREGLRPAARPRRRPAAAPSRGTGVPPDRSSAYRPPDHTGEGATW